MSRDVTRLNNALDEACSFFDGTTERPLDHVEALAWDLLEQLEELRAAATPFGHMAQEMLTGHPTGHLSAGVPERLLAALKAVDGV